MNQDNNPLVSIVVITYNSAKFVLETLESTKSQTYKNIELIISDDGSTDNTLEICGEWLRDNKNRFVNTEILTVEKNTGIPANCNRGVKASKGEWIKFVAGDDTLLMDNIKINIDICLIKNINVLQTNINYFIGTFELSNYIRTSSQEKNIFFATRNSNHQLEMLLYSNHILAPSIFFNVRVIEKVGGFDESIKLIEDYPLWIKLTSCGFLIECSDEVTVNYRLSSRSVMRQGNKFIMSPTYAKNLIEFAKKYKYNRVNNLHYFSFLLGLRLQIFFVKSGITNKLEFIEKLIGYMLGKLMNVSIPYRLLK